MSNDSKTTEAAVEAAAQALWQVQPLTRENVRAAARRALEAAAPRTITTVEELDALPEGSVVMGFDKWDHDPIVSTKQHGEWSLAGSDNGYQHAGLDQACNELTVLHESDAETTR